MKIVSDKEKKYWNGYANRFSRIYTSEKSGFERWIDFLFRQNLKHRFNYTFQFTGELNGKSIIDVGCGTGKYLREALTRGAASVTGVDTSDKMLGIARRTLNTHFSNSRSWSLVGGTFEDIKLKKSFNFAFAIGLFDYHESPAKVLQKLQGISGYVICTFPCRWAFRVPLRRIWLRSHGLKLNVFTKRNILTLSNQTGFSIVNLRHLGPVYWVVLKPVLS